MTSVHHLEVGWVQLFPDLIRGAAPRAGHKLKLEALTLRPAGVDTLGLDTGDGSEWYNRAHYRNRTSLYGEGVRGWRDGKPLLAAG